MATLIYNTDAGLVETQQEGPDKAVIGNMEIPFITGSQLRQYAATVYSESSNIGWLEQIAPQNPLREMQRETFAIAFTMYNYAMAKGAALRRAGRVYGLNELLSDKSYTKGIGSPAHQQYMTTGGDETRRRMATMAVMRIFTRKIQDLSDVVQGLQGATNWDGNDLFRRFQLHYRAQKGFELADPNHGAIYQNVTNVQNAQIITTCPAQDPKVAALRQFTYLSTMTAGGTIFFKLHPEAVAKGVNL